MRNHRGYGELLGRCSLFLLLLAGPAARAAVVYVSANGTQSGSYANWSEAFTNLQAALDYAATNAGTTIYLAGGQTLSGPAVGAAYPRNSVFVWQNATNVTLSGGWNTDAAPPTTRTTSTILKRTTGDYIRILSLVNVSNAVIDQVTIRDGAGKGTHTDESSGDAGGVLLWGCRDVTFRDSTIVNNIAYLHDGSAWSCIAKGGGMYLRNSQATATNTTIAYNESVTRRGLGGGIYIDATSRMTLMRSTVQGNAINNTDTSGDIIRQGAGLYVESGGALDIYETVLYGNSGPYCSGVLFNSGTLRMRNSLLCGNVSTYECIVLAGGAASMVNCTIASNKDVGISYSAGPVALTNCIAWGHMAADLSGFSASALSNVAYSIFATPGTQHGVNHCLTNNPQFVSAVSNNYRLALKPVKSPALDAGFNDLSGWMLSDTDLVGARRRQNGTIDIGAYEMTPPGGSVLVLR